MNYIVYIFCIIFVVVESYDPNVYFKYPENLIPNKEYTSGEFILMSANVALEKSDMTLPKELLMNKYRHSESHTGFVFDSSDIIKFVLVRKTGKKTFRFGPMIRGDGLHFYERIPERYEDNTVYIERFYDFDNMNDQKLQRGKDTKFFCFVDIRDVQNQNCTWTECQKDPICEKKKYSGNARYSDIVGDPSHCDRSDTKMYECCSEGTGVSLREMCKQIPKYLGYIEETCLVGHAALSEPLKFTTGMSYIYFEKRRQHDSIKYIQENWEYIVSWTVALFFLFLLLPENITWTGFINMEIDYSWFIAKKYSVLPQQY